MRLEGHYQVSLNGFRCNSATWDTSMPMLPEEGYGDEVFFQIERHHFDSDGNPTRPPTVRTTRTIGSAGNGRYPFGQATDFLRLFPRGGVTDGDVFPTPQPWVRAEPFPNPDDVPPLLLWAGELISDWDGDSTEFWTGRRVVNENSVFLTTTLWDRDPGEDMLEGWLRWQAGVDTTFGQKAKEAMVQIYPAAVPFFAAVSLGIQTAATLFDIVGRRGTRPIGTQLTPQGPDSYEVAFTPFVLDLTQARAEQLIREDLGNGPGVLPINYRDDPRLRGDYDVWLQVERVGILRELPPRTVPASSAAPVTSGAPALGGTVLTPSGGLTPRNPLTPPLDD